MSVIAHRCNCGHTDMDHAREHGGCSFGYCRCQIVRHNVAGPSEVVMTYKDTDTTPVHALIPPGEQLGSDLGPRIKTCACGECKAVYAGAVA